MSNNTSKNKRIFKNTAVLYVRMILVMIITLYSSRVVLQALGIEDFGLYNVVGGVIGLMAFLNTTMAKTTQRFLNVEMVKGEESLSSIFASSITVHLLFAALFLLVGETLGLWFLNAKVNIPEGRELASNIVYQAALLSFCTSIIMTPYHAAVVAYERMTFVAVASITDAILKLSIALFLLSYHSDRLSLYGILLYSIAVLDFIMYFFYCRSHYPVLKFHLSLNKENLRQIFSYTSWTIVGQFAIVGCNQGNVLLVNMYHSLVANAAMSVGSQVNHAISNLTSNFQTAFNPQITKSYAEGDYPYLKSLSYSASKISFCILFIVALPVGFNIDYILHLWLNNVPELSNTFALLFIANGILNAISSPFNFTVLSSGNIRNFQIVVSIIFLADLPIVLLLFSLGFPPTTVMLVKIGSMALAMYARLYFASKVAPTISVMSYIREVLTSILVIASVTIALAYISLGYAEILTERIIYTLLIESMCIVLMWMICLKQSERESLLRIVKSIIRK